MNAQQSLLVLAAIATAACGGARATIPDSTNPFGVAPPPGAKAEFSVIPVALTGTLTPLGNLNPPGHTLPTDHVYFYTQDFDHVSPAVPGQVRAVYAPATGTIDFMLHFTDSDDWKVQFIVTDNFGYYFDHLHPRADLKVGTIVHSGDSVGTQGPTGALDLGAYDLSTTLTGFITPSRYPLQSLHCVSPYKYFVEPLRSQLYARIRRSPATADKDGRIDFSVPGRLVGDWYHESLAATADASAGPNGWPKNLAFVYDYYDPSLVRVSIGGTIAKPGVWGIEPSAPRPETVSVESGKVSYRLMYTESTTVQSGLMIVQMLDDKRIRVEVFEGSHASTADFDTNAQIYLR